MATYYVGPGGNDANDGLSWAQRKLTLSGAEAIPVAAGDLCYVAPGVYRETLTVGVSGVAGSPITYIGDYSGANTDGVGGVVRITGSDDDQIAVRGTCINAGAFSYRTFRGFQVDHGTSRLVDAATAGTNWTIEQCAFFNISNGCIYINGANQAAWTIRNCLLSGNGANIASILITHNASVSDAGHVIENCIFQSRATDVAIRINFIGGVTIRNSIIAYGSRGILAGGGFAAGQTVTVQNCILFFCDQALRSAVLGDLIEDYNVFYGNGANYFNVSAGLNSVTSFPLFDTRWFFEAVNGGRLVTPFDLGPWSQLIDLAGLNPPATDLRGTGQIGAARERGPLEYDPTLLIEGGVGGAVSISPYRGNL